MRALIMSFFLFLSSFVFAQEGGRLSLCFQKEVKFQTTQPGVLYGTNFVDQRLSLDHDGSLLNIETKFRGNSQSYEIDFERETIAGQNLDGADGIFYYSCKAIPEKCLMGFNGVLMRLRLRKENLLSRDELSTAAVVDCVYNQVANYAAHIRQKYKIH